jgi:hypothetical protein
MQQLEIMQLIGIAVKDRVIGYAQNLFVYHPFGRRLPDLMHGFSQILLLLPR